MHATKVFEFAGADLRNATRAILACAAFAGTLLTALPACFAAVPPAPDNWTALKARSSIERRNVRLSAVENIVAPTDVTEERRAVPHGIQLASLGEDRAEPHKEAGRKAKARRRDQVGIASFYWQPQALASGGRFNPQAMTAAHKTLPFGTRVRI